MTNSIIRIISATALTLLLVACGNDEPQNREFIRPIKYEQVTSFRAVGNQTFSGTAENENITELSFRASGVITEFDIKLGQKVKKGQLLGKLDNVQAKLMYEQALAQRNVASSQFNTATSNLNRVRELYEKGSSALSDFEAAKNAFRTAEQNYESAKKGVALQQEQIQFGYLYAPEDGEISAIYAEVNENISPGQNIATLNSGSIMEVRFGIPESQINTIHIQDSVGVRFAALNNKKFKGIVTEVAPAASTQTSTYPVRLRLISPDETVRSGMAAKVTLPTNNLATNTNVAMVPIHAVGEDYNGRFVFLVEEQDNETTVKKTTVETGKITNQGFEILAGVKTGQYVATAGLQTLLDGQRVKLR